MDSSNQRFEDEILPIVLEAAAPFGFALVDLNYSRRNYDPKNIEGIGPVLDIHDLVLGKLFAFWDRGYCWCAY